MIHPHEVKQIIENGIQHSTAIVKSDDGRHFTAVVISSEFANKSRIQKQQTVYRTLNAYIQNGTLHAISIKTFTPEEWQHEMTHHG